ncbi:hypothetical protein AB0J72_31880 [Dactylosporangium sp. NPDC049742]|uniref:hypothetical protein n=1 Tax=Dactylosporangium sp. NPDC049742 TaxID=3154737 RepID=UPI00341E7F6B
MPYLVSWTVRAAGSQRAEPKNLTRNLVLNWPKAERLEFARLLTKYAEATSRLPEPPG